MCKNVLIVEDELIVANHLRLILTAAGYNVTGIAASAEEAEIYLPNQTPDLVILDIRLSGKKSGIDLARQLRTENIAFIYLSANSNQEVLEEAKTTEPYGFLVKPFRKKDLLVALEIAWYRHQHSLESKLRREDQLQQNLREIGKEASGVAQTLPKVAQALQSYIPFDFIASGIRPLNAEQFNDIGYLRTGFDEYQYIGEKELLTITGLDKNAFSEIIKKTHAASHACIYNSGVTKPAPDNLLQRKIAESLRMESYLVFPVALGYGLSAHYFFYSRKAGIYNKDHIALLNRLKISLEEVANQTVYSETSSNTTIRRPVVNKGPGDVSGNLGFKGIIGNHHLLLSALDLTAQVAPYNTSVLILGESGTGKEKIAQSIHWLSPRKKGPFINVNCAAIPTTLIESELFGHEKGAFTGAIEKRTGKFELADGGTIFLDEIGEMPLEIQVKLLRVLQEREIEHVGGSKPVKVDVRIVAATNRNLEKEVANGKFRLDLYYRLNVFPITLPSLRERKSDIQSLSYFFADKFCKNFGKPFTGIAESMIEEMMEYSWPGNIRELENILEQSVILNDGKSELELKRSLAVHSTGPVTTAKIKTLGDIKNIQLATEREYIISALKKTNGRVRGVNGAAQILSIKPTTLESKMIKLNIKKEDFTDMTRD